MLFRSSGATPFDVIGTYQATKAGTAMTAPGITTTLPNAPVLMAGFTLATSGNVRNHTGWTTTSPGTLTELADTGVVIGATAPSVGIASAVKAAAGATGNGTATVSNAGVNTSAILVALAPVVNAPPLTLAQAAAQSDPTNVASVAFTLSAAGTRTILASSITAADFTVTNGSVASIGCSGSTCTITVTPAAEGAVTIAPSGSFSVKDQYGIAATTAGGSDRSVTYDLTAPTVSSIVPALTPTNGATASFTVTFSESVTGGSASSFSLTTSGITGESIAGVDRKSTRLNSSH